MNEQTTAELQRLYDRDGLLLPETVVEEARPETNPLHSHFTWDDDDAAEKWRQEEARGLIRKARIVLIKAPDTVEHVRAYVSVEHNGERGYMQTEHALRQHGDQVLERALVELDAMRRRYERLVDFDQVLRRALDKQAA